jgi:hypothetical protein
LVRGEVHGSVWCKKRSRECASQACTEARSVRGRDVGCTFLQQYALCYFFFHLSMVYALLRQQGLPLSKGDFDGWHVYQAQIKTL